MKPFFILVISLISLSLFGENNKRSTYIPDENHTPPQERSQLNLRQAQEAELEEEREMSAMEKDPKKHDHVRDDLKEPNDTKMD